MSGYSLYVHIPFCRHKCSYCDFNTYAGLESLLGDYMQALCREAVLLAEAAGQALPLQTLYFGGGTPSLVPPDLLEKFLRSVDEHFALQAGVEFTLEANPGTLSLAYLRDLSSLGVNRISLGMQSARPPELALLERQHDYGDVVQAVRWIRQVDLGQYNLDLIFGLPDQTLDDWQQSLESALALHPDHLSLYALTLEHGTPLHHWVNRGLVVAPDPDLAAEMYEWAARRLEQAGYVQYEISNWALPDSQGELRVCRHNLQYWRNLPYLGLGAGAHGFAASVRTANTLTPAAYIQRCMQGAARAFPRTPATASVQWVDERTEMQETLFMGLRLTREGVSRRMFQDRFGRPLENVFGQEVEELLGLGLLEWVEERDVVLRLTPRGRLLGNQVFMRFI